MAVDEQLLSTAIKLYPNLVSEILSIDFTDVSGEAELIIYNSSGVSVEEKNLKTRATI